MLNWFTALGNVPVGLVAGVGGGLKTGVVGTCIRGTTGRGPR